MKAERVAEEQVRKFDSMLAAAKQDQQTVTPNGQPLKRITEGVTVHDLTTHVDERGTLVEMFDPRWNWHPDPLVFVYHFTIRPNIVKGWNLHRRHEDRYCLVYGEMKLVLYDTRPGSSTFGEICEIMLSERRRCLVNIPRDVWHADQNIGSSDVLVVNFPTIQYEHRSPDKFRLPIGTPLIPYSFQGARGW